jgi:hypothetical protein
MLKNLEKIISSPKDKENYLLITPKLYPISGLTGSVGVLMET